MTSDHYTVSMSAKAHQDLRTLADYVVRERLLDDAVALVDAVRGQIESLEQFPNRGSVPEEVRAFGETDFRHVFVGRYRILHLVENNKVTITMVADGSRDIFALPKRRLTSGQAGARTARADHPSDRAPIHVRGIAASPSQGSAPKRLPPIVPPMMKARDQPATVAALAFSCAAHGGGS